MSRIKVNEITPKRIIQALRNRAIGFSLNYSWKNSNVGKENKKELLMFKDKHKGETCYLFANGPSLSKMDLSVLKDKYTFGMNRIYLLFDKLGFETTYFACINELVLDQFSDEIGSLKMPKFLNWSVSVKYKNYDNVLFVKDSLAINDSFGNDLTQSISSGGTVTFGALQICYYLGFTKVIIVGLDHNFVEKGTPNKIEKRESEKDESHFHPDYFPKGIKWQLPDLYRSELAYAMARQAYESDGRKIIDCTPDGKCDVFEKGNLKHFL